jgi:hypothetical protein
VRADVVVVAAEPRELAPQAGDGLARWLRGEPLLLGLLEAFDLALGLGVVGAGVLEPDAEAAELEGVLKAWTTSGPVMEPSRASETWDAFVGTIRTREAVAWGTGLSPVAHTSVLYDDGCDYQDERCQSHQIDVRAKLAFAIHGRKEKEVGPEGGEG